MYANFNTFALRDPVSGAFVVYNGGGQFKLSSSPPTPDMLASIFYALPYATRALGVLSVASSAYRIFLASDGWSMCPPQAAVQNVLTPVTDAQGNVSLWTGSAYVGLPGNSPTALPMSSTPVTWDFAQLSTAYWLSNAAAGVAVGSSGGSTPTVLASIPLTEISTSLAAVPFEVCLVGSSAQFTGGVYIAAALGSLVKSKSTVTAWCAPAAGPVGSAWSAQLASVTIGTGVPVAPTGMVVLIVTFDSTGALLFQNAALSSANWYVAEIGATSLVLASTSGPAPQPPQLAWLRDTNFKRSPLSFLALQLPADDVPFPMPALPPTPARRVSSAPALSTLAIIGIVVGSVVVLLAIVLGAVYGHRAAVRKANSKSSAPVNKNK
jgi:hypothetical protein